MTLAFDLTVRRNGFEAHFSRTLAQPFSLLAGASGAGKTTLLDAIAGVLAPDDGQLSFDGRAWVADGAHVTPAARGVGYAFQDNQLFRHLTVAKNVRFGLQARPHLADRIDPDWLLDRFGLRSLAARRPTVLSGGEQKRVAIARAILASERLVLLDEPFGAVDAPMRMQVIETLRELQAAHQLQFVIVTHTSVDGLDDAERLTVAAGGIATTSR